MTFDEKDKKLMNTKEKLYKEALGITLSKLRADQDEVSPQLLNAVVSLLKLDESDLKEKDTSIIQSFIKDVVKTTDKADIKK